MTLHYNQTGTLSTEGTVLALVFMYERGCVYLFYKTAMDQGGVINIVALYPLHIFMPGDLRCFHCSSSGAGS